MTDTTESIHDQLSRAQFEADDGDEPDTPSFDDTEAKAGYWRARFEEERERLAKLWVAYRDVEAEVEALKTEAEELADRKAAAQLAQAEQARAEEDEDEEGVHPGVLAIAPPDEFEVMCEAEERDVVAGRGTSFPLVFVNRGDEPVQVDLSVEESPEGWSALTTEREIELEARSSRTVYAIVRPRSETPVGETARIVVSVAASNGIEETIELAAEIVERPNDATEDDEEPEPLDGDEAEDSPELDEPIEAAVGDEAEDVVETEYPEPEEEQAEDLATADAEEPSDLDEPIETEAGEEAEDVDETADPDARETSEASDTEETDAADL